MVVLLLLCLKCVAHLGWMRRVACGRKSDVVGGVYFLSHLLGRVWLRIMMW